MMAPPVLKSFPPVIDLSSRILVLGTMPGARSLEADEYYAHPRNAFWQLTEDILGIPAALPYAERKTKLTAGGLALWDVLASCERQGSLDTAIRKDRPNAFEALFLEFPNIEAVFFNGGKAEKLWERHIAAYPSTLMLRTLPSSSPAYAAMSYSVKRKVWSDAISERGLAVNGHA